MTEREILEKLAARQRAYASLFGGEFGETVLADLTSFCRGKSSTFHADPRIHAVLEGRREVYLRIMDHLDLKPEEFLGKYTNKKIGESTE